MSILTRSRNTSPKNCIGHVSLAIEPLLRPRHQVPRSLLLHANCSILFLWSKGSRQIHAYHLNDKSLELLPSFDCAELQLAISFLPKVLVDVRKVEIIQGLRFTAGNKIERFGFTIPRNRAEYFQDDVFVETRDTTTPSMSAAEWFEGVDERAKMISLKPDDMIPCTRPTFNHSPLSPFPLPLSFSSQLWSSAVATIRISVVDCSIPSTSREKEISSQGEQLPAHSK